MAENGHRVTDNEGGGGAMMLPWATPEIIGNFAERESLIWVNCSLLVR